MAQASRSPRTAFVLQGGGALGAYQAGAISRLAQSGVRPDLVAGISIGAINAALVAGNPPEARASRLKQFWKQVSARTAWPGLSVWGPAMAPAAGAPGFFAPRLPPFAVAATGSPDRAGFYDTAPLRRTLEELVDFDLLDAGPVQLVVGSVNVASGNFVWFDTAERRIGPEHIMASGALPPGFPPVEVHGEFFWDGGLVSDTPLARVIETRKDAEPMVIWQVDLFSARGPIPHSIWSVEAREKDIRFSSRTRAVTDRIRAQHALAAALQAHAAELPAPLASDPAVARLLSAPACAPLTLIHLIYRAKPYETGAKDCDFSRDAMQAHRAAGVADAAHSLMHPHLSAHDPSEAGMHVFDLAASHEQEPTHDRG
ncbi:MAG: patatin-like phospholipase family protein [Gemmobacter sp.]|uniref:patatin-like phospholipase family protein n=1 Tax=Gemmobacter sp. TaxID=1898957 RepID=UPI00391A977E